MDNSLLGVALAATCLGVVYVMMRAVIRDLNSSRREAQLTDEIQRRQPLEDDAFHRESFADGEAPEHVASAVRRLVAESVKMPPNILRADEDYSVLAHIAGADLDDESALIGRLEEHFGISFTDEELKVCPPVLADVIRLVAKKLESV